jgi:outer membrane protein assembly factor BamB
VNVVVVCYFTGLLQAFSQATNHILWQFPTGKYVFSSPAIAEDGTIYIGSASSNLYALNPNGTRKWSFPTDGEIQSSPAVGADGTIYFGSADRKLYALKPDGTEQWEFATADLILSSPTLGADGTIYIGSRDGKVYAIHRDGTAKWEFATGEYYTDMPAVIGPQGTIYIGVPGKLYALNRNGRKLWDTAIIGSGSVSVVIGKGGRIYATSGGFGMRIIALTHDGRRLWEFAFGSPTVLDHPSFPALGPDGTIYIATSDGYLYAINADGTLKWKTPATRTQSSPALSDDGRIYLNSSWDFRLLCYDTSGGLQWEQILGGAGASGLWSSFPTLRNGVIYVGSGNGNVYAISALAELAQSEWPMFGRDLQHSGRDLQRGIEATLNPFTGAEELSFIVEVGRPYRVQGTTDLVQWITCTNFISSTSVFRIPRPSGPCLFYRLASP